MLVQFKRSKAKFVCDDCGNEVEVNAPYWYLEFELEGRSVCICEDCGGHLQNDMADEYSKFVDMDKQCPCNSIKSINSGMKCSNCGREL